MRKTRFRSVVLTAALALTGALVTSEGATAAPQAGCQYKVVWPSAGVYELPNPNSTVVKVKHAGDIVGASTCEFYSYNEYMFALVASDSASDGRGWMRTDALVYL